MDPKETRRAMRSLVTNGNDIEATEYWIGWLNDKDSRFGLFTEYLLAHPLSPSLRSKVALQIIIHRLEA